ncbi:hypothetical protein [Streptomyces sp. NBC_01190]|uniref:hypothetical protein n=1 Tax=Streptomyces sp. NBC_01190 TaxID=2903767 RepID=UPI00386BFF06|nr:hypothetical protein OG519_17735 [Streptomyces sp. NBC_01190]
MSSSPTLRCGNTLVVFDGSRRLVWSASSTTNYTPVALWPTPEQAAEVLDHLAGGGNLLVMVEEETTTVPMYAEEAARMPAELTERISLTSDGVLSELQIPALDWLPEPLRQRGLRFLRDSARRLAHYPDLLLPPLLMEEPGTEPESADTLDSADTNVRFARRRTVRPYSDDRLAPVSDHLFPSLSYEPYEAVLETTS